MRDAEMTQMSSRIEGLNAQCDDQCVRVRSQVCNSPVRLRRCPVFVRDTHVYLPANVYCPTYHAVEYSEYTVTKKLFISSDFG